MAPTEELQRPTVVLSTYEAGDESVKATFRFAPVNSIPKNGRIVIGFPRDGFTMETDINKVSISSEEAAHMYQEHPSSIVVTDTCYIVTVRVSDEEMTTFADGTVIHTILHKDEVAEFAVDGLTNRGTAGPTGFFSMFTTKDGAESDEESQTIDEATDLVNPNGRPEPLTIEPAPFGKEPTLKLSARGAGDTGEAIFTFTPTLAVPTGGSIIIWFLKSTQTPGSKGWKSIKDPMVSGVNASLFNRTASVSIHIDDVSEYSDELTTLVGIPEDAIDDDVAAAGM
jgi:hypothetical protein